MSKIGTYRLIIARVVIVLLLIMILCGCEDKYEDLRNSGVTVPLMESQVIRLSVESTILGREIPCKVYLPKDYGGGQDYPVWYGLHGHSADESMWINEVAIDEVADEMIEKGEIEPIIMVFPQTMDATLKEIMDDLEEDGKFDEWKWDQFMWKELVSYIDSHYDTITSAEGRFIGGFSMGGAIALRVAFHHPDLFSKVGGYTAAVPSSDYSDKQLEKWLYPNHDMDEITDVAAFAKEKGLVNLTVYLEAGDENDPFLEGLQSLNTALLKRGVSTECVIYHGGHSLDHARKSVRELLKYYSARD